jgi:hypothetical protein
VLLTSYDESFMLSSRISMSSCSTIKFFPYSLTYAINRRAGVGAAQISDSVGGALCNTHRAWAWRADFAAI